MAGRRPIVFCLLQKCGKTSKVFSSALCVLLSKAGMVFSFFILFANKMKCLIVVPLYDYFLFMCAGRSPLWSVFAREKNPEIEYMLLSVLY